MKESAINNLKEDSEFWDNEYFQYKVTKDKDDDLER